ncbi:MAG: hypothetical protein JW850_15780 [Thermoflexales bacterium]|nr:hypothetical protein [Thermoflexales bacterium]
MSKVNDLVEYWRSVGPAAWASGRYGWIDIDGQPITLTPWQGTILSAWWKLREDITTLAISAPKKCGKTLANAVLLCWRWLSMPGEHYAAGNDLDQSQGRQFQQIAEMCRRNRYLAQNTRLTKNQTEFVPTGSIITALAADYAGAAGSNHLSVSHTEAWGIIHEAGIRLWEELTPPPGQFYGLPALRIADSYAGHLGESDTWHGLIDRALEGKLVSDEWPIYRNGGLLAYHDTGEIAQRRCFRGSDAEREEYYTEQRLSLREGTYRRLHLNERTAAESAFILPEMWDSLILEGYTCPLPGTRLPLVAGLDVAVKRDNCAVVSVYRQDGQLFLGPYRIWKPPVDLDAVEAYIRDLKLGYRGLSLYADPYQAQSILQSLQKSGIKAEEFTQTIPNLTLAGNSLFDVIRQGNLVVYAGATDLRQHVLNASAKETQSGIRLTKAKATQKIDASIALAMAVTSALRVSHRGCTSVRNLGF